MAMEGVLMDESSRLLEGSRIPGCLNSDLRSNEGIKSIDLIIVTRFKDKAFLTHS